MGFCSGCGGGGFAPDAAADVEDPAVVGGLDEGLGSGEFVVQELEPVELVGDVDLAEFGAEGSLDAIQGRRIQTGLGILRGSCDFQVALEKLHFLLLRELKLIGVAVGRKGGRRRRRQRGR